MATAEDAIEECCQLLNDLHDASTSAIERELVAGGVDIPAFLAKVHCHVEEVQRPAEPVPEAFLSGYNAGKYAGETAKPYDVQEAWATYRKHGGNVIQARSNGAAIETRTNTGSWTNEASAAADEAFGEEHPDDTLSGIENVIHEWRHGVHSDIGALAAVRDRAAIRYQRPETPANDPKSVLLASFAGFIAGQFRLDKVHDHACAQCVPDGPIVIEGYQCIPHMAHAMCHGARPTGSTPIPEPMPRERSDYWKRCYEVARMLMPHDRAVRYADSREKRKAGA